MTLPGCSDMEYEVTLLIPHVYRLMAPDAELAKEAAAQRWAFGVTANAVGFPEEMRIKCVESAEGLRTFRAIEPAKGKRE